MTDKMICCFCKSELVKSESTVADIWNCPNENCKAHTYFGDKDFWQVLTDGKKAQEIIRDLLTVEFWKKQNYGETEFYRIESTKPETKPVKYGDLEDTLYMGGWKDDKYSDFAECLVSIIKNKLETSQKQIASITKGDKE